MPSIIWLFRKTRTVTYEDKPFSKDDWDMEESGPCPQLKSGTVTWERNTPPGQYPPNYFDITLTIRGGAAPDPPNFSRTVGAFIRRGMTLAPESYEWISSIDYFEDYAFVSNQAHQGGNVYDVGSYGQVYGPLIRQAGVYYAPINILDIATDGSGKDTAWAAKDKKFQGLTASDFGKLDVFDVSGGGYVDPNSHPDFGKGAPPLEFGFMRGNSSAPGGVTADFCNSRARIRNWRFDVRVSRGGLLWWLQALLKPIPPNRPIPPEKRPRP